VQCAIIGVYVNVNLAVPLSRKRERQRDLRTLSASRSGVGKHARMLAHTKFD
jgi:hypothetical protein